MAFLSEEVLIKILVGADKALKTLKDVDKNVEKIGKTSTTSAKSMANMGIAFGGAAVGLNLLVKGISAQISKIKESETAYVNYARASGNALSAEIVAIDNLALATAELRRVQGEATAKALEDIRNRVAARRTEQAQFVKYGGLWEEAWRQSEITGRAQLTIFNEMVAQMERLAKTGAEFGKASSGVTPTAEQNAALAQKQADAAAQALKIESDRIEAQKIADMLAMSAYNQRIGFINAETEAERNRINASNAFYLALQETQIAAHDAEMERIEAEKEARMEAAQVALESASSMFGTIGELVSQRYQHEIDAAEGNEEKQNELRKKQFNAEKAFAVVQSLIATALGITKAIPNIPLMVFSAAQGALQTALIAGQRAPSFATGTPPGGYVVPPGYDDDSFPVRAKSGETVTVTNGATGGGQTIIIELDGRQLGRAVTGLFENRYARVPAAVVA